MKTITVFGKKFKSRKTGIEFIRYQYSKDGVKFYDVKFTKDCATTPNLLGWVKITFDQTTSSIQRGKVNEGGVLGNDIIWVRNLVAYEQDEEYAKAHPSKKQKELDELFND